MVGREILPTFTFQNKRDMEKIRITLSLSEAELHLLLTTMGLNKEQLEEALSEDNNPDQLDVDRHAVVTKVFRLLQKKYYEMV